MARLRALPAGEAPPRVELFSPSARSAAALLLSGPAGGGAPSPGGPPAAPGLLLPSHPLMAGLAGLELRVAPGLALGPLVVRPPVVPSAATAVAGPSALGAEAAAALAAASARGPAGPVALPQAREPRAREGGGGLAASGHRKPSDGLSPPPSHARRRPRRCRARLW